MKKALLLISTGIIVLFTYSCSGTDEIAYEPEITEPHIPQDRKIKSIFVKTSNDSLQMYARLTEKYNYSYNSNGYIAKKTHWYNNSQSESSTNRYYYYTNNLIDSMVVEMQIVYTAGINEGNKIRVVFAHHYFHNDEGFITESKEYIREAKYPNDNLLKQEFYYYDGDLLSKHIYKTLGTLGENVETVETNYNYREGNFLRNNDQRHTFDDRKFFENNVYSPSMHRISCLYVNNITAWYYGYSNIELSRYTYNEDMYPLTQVKRNEQNKILSTHTFEYY